MTTTVEDQIDSDTTPMDTCGSCGCPVDLQGRNAAARYIHQVESERQEVEDLVAQMLTALEPFAAMANRYPSEAPDSTPVLKWQDKPVVSLGDLRRAKTYVDAF